MTEPDMTTSEASRPDQAATPLRAHHSSTRIPALEPGLHHGAGTPDAGVGGLTGPILRPARAR